MKLSNGFRTQYMAEAWTSLFDGVEFYSGPMPASGDSSPTGTKLAVVRGFHLAQIAGAQNFGEFVWVEISPGAVEAKPADGNGGFLGGDVQSMPAIATGTIGYALLGSPYASSPSPTGPSVYRMYASVGTSEAEIIVASLNVVAGDTVGIKTLRMSIPSS